LTFFIFHDKTWIVSALTHVGRNLPQSDKFPVWENLDCGKTHPETNTMSPSTLTPPRFDRNLPVNGNGNGNGNENGHHLRFEIPSPIEEAGPVFASQAMRDIIAAVEKIAPSSASIMIVGETGTGKEVIADRIHNLSRPDKPFVKINCAAMPRELIESELFGHVKGAFSGAYTDREGLFREARIGTLLLDELAEMPPDTQTKLLRVLQDMQVRPVGGSKCFPIACRVLASTNQVPEEAIRAGKLRGDLFYRVSTVVIALPSLRSRRDDIIPLAQAFARQFGAEKNPKVTSLTATAEGYLLGRDWPGNIRELQNYVHRAVLMAEGEVLGLEDFGQKPKVSIVVAQNPLGLTPIQSAERDVIVSGLKRNGGNKVRTALDIGMSRQSLHNKMKEYGIAPP